MLETITKLEKYQLKRCSNKESYPMVISFPLDKIANVYTIRHRRPKRLASTRAKINPGSIFTIAFGV